MGSVQSAASMKGRVIEIFESVQGEGLWVGRSQVFVRLHGCKLQCVYCDTPLTHKNIHECRVEYPPLSKSFEKIGLEFEPSDLIDQIHRFQSPSTVFTGGEPLEQVEFIDAVLQQLDGSKQIFLETSGVETLALSRIVDRLDMVSMDIKIPSATGEKGFWGVHAEFMKLLVPGRGYAKVVFNEKMNHNEMEALIDLLKAHPHIPCIFQPMTPMKRESMSVYWNVFQSVSARVKNETRLIPQVHKYLGLL